VRGNDGKVYFTEDLGKARNDAVHEGAMEQTVSNSAGEKEIMDLIAAGAVDIESDTSELITNGKVCRKAALRMQFNGPDKALGARIMNAIAKQNKENQMGKEELLAAIKAAIANSTLTLEEISKAAGLENKLRNATDEQRAKLAAAIAEALELPPETPAEELLKAAEEAFKEAADAAESVTEAEANEAAGGKKIKNAKGEEEDNPLYLYIIDKFKGKNRKERAAIRNSLSKDPIAVKLRSQQADGFTITRANNEKKNDLASLDEQIDKILNKGASNG
jgi:lambda repressor-like predicted transcriptional regulator